MLVRVKIESEKCVLFWGDRSQMDASRGVDVDPNKSFGVDNGVLYIRTKHYTDGDFTFFISNDEDEAAREAKISEKPSILSLQSRGEFELFDPDGTSVISCKTIVGSVGVRVFSDGGKFPDIVGIFVEGA